MVEIKEVKTKAQKQSFVDFPNRFYRNEPNFVPAFYDDDMKDWDKSNPAMEYCEFKMFLAYKDGNLVGRVGAILSHKANEKWNTKRMRFSQLDFIDDFEVSKALMDAVEKWAIQKGCNEVHGPLGFCDLDREGLLIEGFDKRSMFITYYNYPYYKTHLEKLGYKKDTDWIEHLLPVGDGTENDEIYQHLKRISDKVLSTTKLHKVELKTKNDMKPYVKKAFDLVNICYAPLYGTVELTDKQVKKYAKKFLPICGPDYCCFIVDDNDELMAFGVGAPSMANAMKKSNGRLFPTGWVHVLNALKHNDTLDLFLIAVRPELQKTGLSGVLMEHVYAGCVKNGIKHAETGPQLETNTKVYHQWKMFKVKPQKRRRCFIKKI